MATRTDTATPLHLAENPIPSIYNPLSGVTHEEAQRFHEKYRLPVEQDVFIRGVIALRSESDITNLFENVRDARSKTSKALHKPIELSVGEQKYTRLESQILYKAFLPQSRWETLRDISRLHRLLIMACIFAAVTQGWDQAAMAGAAIEVMNNLGKPTTAGQSSGFRPSRRADSDLNVSLGHNDWLLGITIGVPFFAGAILGLIITDPITRILRFGRRGAICVAGIFSFISVIGSASVHKWEHLLGFRILLGAGMAGKASIVPILLSETSPKNIRGFLLVFWQLFVAFGLAAGSVANMAVYSLNVHSSWRYMFISAFIPALILLSLILFSPESPRWLLKESGAIGKLSKNGKHSKNGKNSKKGKLSKNDSRRGELIREAYNSLVDLRGEVVPILAAGELFLMHTRLIDEQRRLKAALAGQPYTTSEVDRSTHASLRVGDNSRSKRPKNPFHAVIKHISWRERITLIFFRSGYTNRAHRAAAAVMVSQQLCGINLIAFMADSFFRYSFFKGDIHTNPDQNMQLLGASLGLMFLNFIATIPALFFIDRSGGRRRVLNWSFPVMAISLLGSALVLKAEDRIGAIAGHYIFLIVFMIAYSIGEGPAAFVISAEVFPLVNRELGMSLAVCWNFLGAGLLAVLTPWLLKRLDQFGVLLLFAGTNVIAWFLCYWLVPSTGQESLEEVFDQLDITTWFMFKYTLRTISHALTAPVEWCSRPCSKPLKDCGYPKKLGSPRQEWNERAKRSADTLADPTGSPETSADEMDQVDQTSSNTETNAGIELLPMPTIPPR